MSNVCFILCTHLMSSTDYGRNSHQRNIYFYYYFFNLIGQCGGLNVVICILESRLYYLNYQLLRLSQIVISIIHQSVLRENDHEGVRFRAESERGLGECKVRKYLETSQKYRWVRNVFALTGRVKIVSKQKARDSKT